MVVGFNPSYYDCQACSPFSSNTDAALNAAFSTAGVDRESVYLTFGIKGWSEAKKPGKRVLKACAGRFLFREIAAYKPTKLVLLGADVLSLFIQSKFNDVLNHILVGPHFHVFSGYDPGYFSHIGLDSSQCKTFIRELSKFLSPKYRVNDITPLPDLDSLFSAEYKITSATQNRIDDDIGFMEYRNGSQALQYLESFIVPSKIPVATDNETTTLEVDLPDPLEILVAFGVSDGTRSLSIWMNDLHIKQKHTLLNMVSRMYKTRPIVGHNLKFDLKPFLGGVLTLEDSEFKWPRLLDTWLIAFLVSELEGSYGLKQLAFRELGISDYGIDTSKILEYPPAEVRIYNAKDCFYTWHLLKLLWPRLTKRQQWLCNNVISHNILSFCYMEKCGIAYSKKVLAKFKEFVTGEVEEALLDMRDFACGITGEDTFNPASRHQVSKLIRAKNWRIGDIEECKDGHLPSNAEAIAKIQILNKKNKSCTKFCGLLQRWSKYAEMVSKYITGNKAYWRYIRDDHRIHYNVKLTGTGTGRIATGDPNVLNIHRTDRLPPVMRESNKDGKLLHPERVPRSQFRVRYRNRKLVGGDLSQAELRCLACESDDKRMIEIYNDPEADLHTETALEMFYRLAGLEIPEDGAKKWQRQVAKTTNFGMVYLQGARGLYETLTMSFAEQGLEIKLTLHDCETFHSSWFDIYSGAARWIEDTKRFAEKHGYTESAFGRRRHFVFSDTNRNALLREAVNHPLQSFAAELTFMWQNNILERLVKNNLTEGNRVQLVKNEYDAVYTECDDSDVGEVCQIYKDAFTLKVGDYNGIIKVPFQFDLQVGTSLATMEKIKF